MPDQSSTLEFLLAGNRHASIHGSTVPMLSRAKGRSPLCALICCCECGESPEQLFAQPAGSMFVITGAGPRADAPVVASLAYAMSTFELQLVLVLSHRRCAFEQQEQGGAIQLDLRAGAGRNRGAAWLACRVARQIESHPGLRQLRAKRAYTVVPLVFDEDTATVSVAS